MNRLVCERKVNNPVNCLLEVKERSSRTHGGVRGSPHQSLLVGQSTRLANVIYSISSLYLISNFFVPSLK